VEVYPNPFAEEVRLSVTATEPAPLSYELKDLTGRTVRSGIYSIQAGANQITIDNLEALAHGVYSLVVRTTTLGFFAAIGLPGLAGFVSEAMTLVGAFQADDKTFQVLVLISVLGIVMTAAFQLWAMQRVYLGPLNEKYRTMPDITARETFCQAPLLALCVILGIFPFYLLNWMEPSVANLVAILKASS
jgi:NADH:ubiquinone oxidoreductase subunit 4 (subunit M)